MAKVAVRESGRPSSDAERPSNYGAVPLVAFLFFTLLVYLPVSLLMEGLWFQAQRFARPRRGRAGA